MKSIVSALLIVLFSTVALATSIARPPQAELEWIENLKDGQKQALEKRQPMLVILGAQWCPPCRLLDKEIAKPAVQEKLTGWTRVHLDVDKTPNAAELLGGQGAIPHLKVMTATGRTVASYTGLMSGEELIKWLAANHDEATAGAGEELIGAAAPNAGELVKLLEHLKHAEPALREAAIARLAPHRAIAAEATVEAFAKGNLATRLSALELLIQWKAPVNELDPWQPGTVSEERVTALRAWAKSPTSTTRPATRPA
jgi:thioredoxin-like negative regulator of GroEL